MAIRTNELFIGTEYLNIEGRTIKHPALIRHYASVNPNKMRDTMIDVVGIDIETNHKTGEMMLLGFDYSEGYHYYTSEFVRKLFQWVKKAMNDDMSLAYWNRLDPYVILRTMIQDLDFDVAERALARFGKESGEWDRKSLRWDIDPIVKLDIDGHEFGIKNVIRSSIQFYIYNPLSEKLKTIWAFDIAGLYMKGLEKEAGSRFNWYSKVDESAHKVDWMDFATDEHYRENIVLKSNRLDAKACRHLAYRIQEDFKRAFGTYPKSLVSQGSLARTAIVADITNELKKKQLDKKALEEKVKEEVKSIGIMNYYDQWATKYGHDFMKDLYCLFTESYSGGYIDAISYGYAKNGWYADIASAYPGVIKDLFDLRNATWYKGTGHPQRAKKGYTFIRGTVNIPNHINYHPITVKHPFHKDTNIRATGTYKASYILEERDYLKKLGATFEDETWYMVETKGHKSPLADVCMNFINLRKKLKTQGDSAEYMAKIAANSLYGILFEAVDTHEEFDIEKEIVIDESRHDDFKEILKQYKGKINLESIRRDLKHMMGADHKNVFAMWHNPDSTQTPDVIADELQSFGIYIDAINTADIMIEINDLYRLKVKSINKKSVTMKEVRRVGYRAGEFWNPLYASIITGKTRILMAQAAQGIESAGGTPIILMTDSITWQGTKDMLPKEYVKDIKTLGYFEPPEEVKDIICLGSGRYGFKKWDEEEKDFTAYEAKRRGLNAIDIHDAQGEVLGTFNWAKVLHEMAKHNQTTINVSVRTLISPGVVYLSNKFKISDLGRIIDQQREIKSIVGTTKRHINPDVHKPKLLAHKLIKTESLRLDPYMYGNETINDQTLPLLRGKLMEREIKTRKEKRRENVNNAGKRYYEKNQEKIKMMYKLKYQLLKDKGYESDAAKKMANWSNERLEKEGIKLGGRA